ncbi:MAG: bifunctional phosphoserine phosphatase/homoserine phosphotransferase ThrH [Planctomycetota bacterium]
MDTRPVIVAMDLEGVLVPEIWVNVAERTGIDALRRTTRDEPDYDVLMRYRLDILAREGIDLNAIQAVIGDLAPLPGARELVGWIRERTQLIILSDTFYQFATPLMRLLDWPTLFCHDLEVDAAGRLTGYRLRMPDQKRASIAAFHGLNFRTIAFGDSYNDTAMLGAADAGILFRPAAATARDFPRFPVITAYDEVRAAIEAFLAS